MALSLITQPVNIAQKVADVVSQTLVEGDIIVPDVKPDINEILQVDASVYVEEKDIVAGSAKIKGRLEFCILYTALDSENSSVASITPTLPFELKFEMGDVLSDDTIKIRTDMPHIEFSVINSRKLSIKSVVTVNSIAYRIQTNEVITNVESQDGEEIECLFETKNLYHTLCFSDDKFSVSDEFELPAGKPPIGEILKYDVRLTPQDSKCITDKIVTKGDLNVLLLYTAALDQSLQYVEYDLSFTEVLSAENVNETSDVALDYEVLNTVVKTKPDYDGDNIYVEIAADLGVSITAGENHEIMVLEDCFAPSFDTDISRATVKINNTVNFNHINNSIRDMIMFPLDAPKIRQICNISAKPHIKSISLSDGKAEIEGMIAGGILYISDNEKSPVYCVRKEIPFATEFDVEESKQINFDVVPLLTHASYNLINDSQVEVRFNLQLGVKTASESEMEIISNVELSERSVINTEVPSIVIYFVQKDDTLWSISKKYNVTRSSIITANERNENQTLVVGEQLLIPKHSQ